MLVDLTYVAIGFAVKWETGSTGQRYQDMLAQKKQEAQYPFVISDDYDDSSVNR